MSIWFALQWDKIVDNSDKSSFLDLKHDKKWQQNILSVISQEKQIKLGVPI